MSTDEIYQKIQNKISVEILEITGGAKMSDSQVEEIVRKYSAFVPQTVIIEVFLPIKKAMSHPFFSSSSWANTKECRSLIGRQPSIKCLERRKTLLRLGVLQTNYDDWGAFGPDVGLR